MSCSDVTHNWAHSHGQRFPPTSWSLVLAAGLRSNPNSKEALAALCSIYWYPLYAYVRRAGHTVDSAQDLTQGFFARLLEKNYLGEVRPERGKFRSFLLASLKHFVANELDWARAEKRGGDYFISPLDLGSAESRYSLEPAHELTPEKVFEKQWALTLLNRVLTRLGEEFRSERKSRQFDLLKIFLTGEKVRGLYAQTAAELGMTEGALKVAVHRLRRRYRELLRKEIGLTVEGSDKIDEEIRYLLAAISF
jgi:RNA polymerase sigma factor (sigma-70 family)